MEEIEISSAGNTFEEHPAGNCKKWKFMNTICRLCSLECLSNSQNILQKKILEMLEFCSSLCLSETDELPKRICSSCLQSLTSSYLFRKKIEATEILLKTKFKALFPKQDILDIALNKAKIKSLRDKTVSKGKKNSEDIPENIHSTIELNLDLTKFLRVNEKTSVPYVEDLLNYSLTSDSNEEKMEAQIFEADEETPKKVIYNVTLPPLTPIQPREISKSKIFSQTLPDDPPPLVPLKPITNEGTSSKLPSVESSEYETGEKHINSESQQKSHMDICEPSKSLFCNICKKEYKEGKKLIGHLKGHMVPKNFACKICGKKYPNRSTFQIHMRSHTGERPFKCPVCSKGFTRWAGVVSHMQSHEDNRPFKCDSCDQSFKILSNLERHKVLHSGVLPFCCNYCGKTFSQSANLQLHIRTYHTNERPYLCSECGKGFVSSTRLNRHMWVHTGYKPFHCRICSKAYSNSGDLKNHESGAHGNGDCEKPFSCDMCDKRFFYSCRLTKHFKTHQRPYECNQCSKTFHSSNFLDQHVESKHSDGHSANSNGSKSDDLLKELK